MSFAQTFFTKTHNFNIFTGAFQSWIQLFIHFFCTTYPTQANREAGSFPRGLRAYARGHLGQAASPLLGIITHITYCGQAQLERSVSIPCMSLEWRTILEDLENTPETRGEHINSA